MLRQLPPDAFSIDDYERLATERMPEDIWAYFTGGAADELTLQRNQHMFRQLLLQPRVLRDMKGANTELTLLGKRYPFPVFLAPAAYQKLCHPDGEKATAQAASALGIGMTVSTQASTLLEEIIDGNQAPSWLQLYIQHDRGFTESLVRRAEAAGYQALVVTVDAPVSGVRNREQRAGFQLPAGIRAVNLEGLPEQNMPTGSLLDSPLFNGFLDSAITWKDIDWLCSITRLPVLLKGIMHPDDALLAHTHGAQGIIVSNHGGRVLDTVPSTIEVLPEIVNSLNDRIPVLLDGGIRRGTDILKALALGAKAVMIGRPYLSALAVAGPLGIAHLLNILRGEFEAAMTLTGCRTLQDIDSRVLWKETRH